jgi:CBS domain-containing protein
MSDQVSSMAPDTQSEDLHPPRERRISEVMSWSVQTIDVAVTVAEALRFAAARHVYHLPVLDRGYLEGMVCTCDLRDVPGDSPVHARMRTPVVSVPTSAWSSEAVTLMRVRDIGSLPVLYHGFLVGIVTLGDLERAGLLPAGARPACEGCGSKHHVRTVGDEQRRVCLPCHDRQLSG